MSTPTPDLHDTALPRFEDRLWAELSEAHRERRDRRPAVVTPHRPNRRRRPLAVGAAVAVAAATTLVVGIAVLPGGEPRRAEASIEEKVVAATDAALSDSVVHVIDDFIPSSDGLDRETWYDQTTSTSRVRDVDDQGAMVTDNGPAVAPAPGDVAPDLTGHDPGQVVPSDCVEVPAEGGAAQLCEGWDWPEGYPTFVQRWIQSCDTSYAEVEEPFMPTTLSEMDLRDQLADGYWTADGTEVIDGRELIRLRQTPDPDVPSVGQTVYVDPDTYLPVELRSDVGGPDENILRFEYLPRTAANLELLSPPVPEGYTQVDALATCP